MPRTWCSKRPDRMLKRVYHSVLHNLSRTRQFSVNPTLDSRIVFLRGYVSQIFWTYSVALFFELASLSFEFSSFTIASFSISDDCLYNINFASMDNWVRSSVEYICAFSSPNKLKIFFSQSNTKTSLIFKNKIPWSRPEDGLTFVVMPTPQHNRCRSMFRLTINKLPVYWIRLRLCPPHELPPVFHPQLSRR